MQLRTIWSALFAVLIAAVFPSVLKSQTKDNAGKEFYVAFAYNLGAGGAGTFELYITSKTNTSGVVEVKGLGFSQNFVASPGQITKVELPNGSTIGNESVEINDPEEVISGKAVHVIANDEVTVYGMSYKQYSSDAFMAIPVDVLGTEYITMNYPSCPVQENGGGDTPGEFWIVAVNDSTNITITPKMRTSQSQAGVPIKKLMYKGDVFLVQGDRFDLDNDLTGSIIESDLPIAVLSGHVRAAIPQFYLNEGSNTTSRDHLVEQLPPVSAWGDSAIVVPFTSTPSLLPDLVRVVSAEEDNVITVNGIVRKTLNTGDFFEITSLTGPVSIKGTSPILVGQFLHTSKNPTDQFGGVGKAYSDPALALVYPVEQYGDSYTFISVQNKAFTGNHINIVAEATGLDGLVIDGTQVNKSLFSTIPNSNYVYASVTLKQGSHNISGPKPFGITVYGVGPVASYAYTGGSLLKTITPFKTVGLVIDFGDRILGDLLPNGKYGDTFDSVVYLQNISSDPLTITGFPLRGGNDTCFSVDALKGFPDQIAASAFDSIKVHFTPHVPNVRMHSTINAQTEHLRAYVVDVYGRGILDNTQIFSDSLTKKHIDTLDFGIFEQTDPTKDSEVYIANRGAVTVNISNATIIPDGSTLAQANDFQILGFDTIKNPITVPFDMPGRNKTPVHTMLSFTPRGPNGYYSALLDITPNEGEHRHVVLIARVLTIFKPTIQSVPFDTVLLCTEQDRPITVTNTNDFPIEVTDINIIPTISDFSVLTPQPPFTVPANSSRDVIIRTAPTKVGSRTAKAVLSFNLPKGYELTQTLSMTADQIHSEFHASKNIHILPGTDIPFPIYSYSPMEVFGSQTLKLVISYDPTNIEDYDYDQIGTHTEFGAWNQIGDSAGYKEYDYQTLDGSIISGGERNDTIPLIYIKFRSHLNEGDDPDKLDIPVNIQYFINFDHSSFLTSCVDLAAPEGIITIDSTCASPALLRGLSPPSDADIESIMPNPSANGSMSMIMDIPVEGYVRLDVMNALGHPVKTLASETYKPGFYPMHWSTAEVQSGTYYLSLRTAGGSSVRKVIVLH